MKLTSLDGSAQHSASLVSVGRIAPDASAGDAHCAEAETVDRQVATDVDRSGVRRSWSVACRHGAPLNDQNTACSHRCERLQRVSNSDDGETFRSRVPIWQFTQRLTVLRTVS